MYFWTDQFQYQGKAEPLTVPDPPPVPDMATWFRQQPDPLPIPPAPLGLAEVTFDPTIGGTNTGWRCAGSVSEDVLSGDQPWSNDSNATGAPDASHADCTLTTGENSNTLYLSNYGFSIPNGSTINGIEIRVTRHYTTAANGTIVDASVILVVTGESPTDQSAGATWREDIDESVFYGGPSDTQNANPTPAKINSTDFGVRVAASAPTNLAVANLDAVCVRVWYTEPAEPVPDQWYPIWPQPTFLPWPVSLYDSPAGAQNFDPIPGPPFLDEFWVQASEPVFLPDHAIQGQAVMNVDPLADAPATVPELSWFQPASEPIFDKAPLVAEGEYFLGPDPIPQPPPPDVSTWWQQASEPVRVPEPLVPEGRFVINLEPIPETPPTPPDFFGNQADVVAVLYPTWSPAFVIDSSTDVWMPVPVPPIIVSTGIIDVRAVSEILVLPGRAVVDMLVPAGRATREII